MKAPLFVAGDLWPVGLDQGSLDVRLVGPRAAVAGGRRAAESVLEVWFRRGTRTPVAGDRLSTWRDGSTVYAMALSGGERPAGIES